MSVDYARQYRKVRKAVGPKRRDSVWGSMIYACAAGGKFSDDRRSCGFERRVLLGIGCEGPPEMKERGETIPVPFVAGVCERCGGPLQHVRWGEDENFGEERERPDGAAAFVVPGKGAAAGFAERGYGGAKLIRTEAEEEAIKKFSE